MADSKTNKDIDLETGADTADQEVVIENPIQDLKVDVKPDVTQTPEVEGEPDSAPASSGDGQTEAPAGSEAPSADNPAQEPEQAPESSGQGGTADEPPAQEPAGEESPEEEPAQEDAEEDEDDEDDLDRDKKDRDKEKDEKEKSDEEADEDGGEDGEEEPAEEPAEEGAEGPPEAEAPETAPEGAAEATPEAAAEVAPEAAAGEAGAAEAGAGAEGLAAGTGAEAAGAGAAAAGAEAGAGAAAAGAGGAAAAGAGGAVAAGGAAAAGAGGAAAGGAGVAVGWPVILIAIAAVILIILIIWIVSLFGPKTSVNPNDPETKAQIAQIESYVNSGQLSFFQLDDLQKIKEGKIGNSTLQMIDYLAGQHEAMLINYNGQEKNTDTSGNKVAGANLPFEMDISSVDKIKCTDTSNNSKSAEFPIFLTSTYDWGQNIKPGDNIKCAVGYYPGIDPKKEGPYAVQFGPGEFALSQIGTSGKMAAQEKLAEITAEAMEAAQMIAEGKKELSGTDKDNVADLKPATILIDITYADQNMKGGTGGVLTVLKEKIDQIYNAQQKQGGDGVKAVAGLPFGFHISFL